MKVHTAARAFKEGPYVSQFVQPTGTSILAGCGRSISFTRAALYEVLDSMHRGYKPCQIKTYVDDIPQMHTGPADIISDRTVFQAAAIVQKLEAEGLPSHLKVI